MFDILFPSASVSKPEKICKGTTKTRRNGLYFHFPIFCLYLHSVMQQIIIYTDGSSLGNPGAGGFGVVMIAGVHRREISRGYRLTTNNRMELLAVIEGLEALKRDGHDVMVYSDSRYVVDAVEKGWLFGWERKGFAGKKNPDLWQRFLAVYRRHRVRFTWVKGHASIPENERCDQLATTAARGANLSEDSGYESSQEDIA